MFSLFKKLFLENRSLKQIVAKNTFWLVSAEVIARLLGLFLVIYVARTLGATDYGKFTFAFSFTSIMAILCDLGLSDISTREFSRSKENEKKLASILGLETILCLFTLAVAFISSFFITSDPLVIKSIWILTTFVLSNGFFSILFSFLRARQKMEYEAGIKILQAVFNLIIVFLVISFNPSVINLSYGYLLSNVIVLAIFAIYFNSYFQKIGLRFEKNIFEILKISWPLSLGFMVGWVYISINSVMLGYFNLITENGWYNAASRIAIVAIIPASLIVKSFFPALSNFFITSKTSLQKAWNYLMEIMIVIAMPLTLGGVAMAGSIIKLFYGPDFAPSTLALQLLMITVGISLINYPYSIILVVSGQQKKNFLLITLGAIIDIALNIFLIPVFGFLGVIVSSIISCCIVLFCSVILSKKMNLILPFNKELIKIALMSIFSGLLMYAVINTRFVDNLNIVFIFSIGVFVYLFALFALYTVIFPKRILSLKGWKNL